MPATGVRLDAALMSTGQPGQSHGRRLPLMRRSSRSWSTPRRVAHDHSCMLGLVVSFMKSTRPAWGEAGVTQGVCTAQPAVFDHVVFRERETTR